jgi:hypothetical protein
MTYRIAKGHISALADGEAAVTLAGGDIAAVSVSSRWLENNGGVAFVAAARWMDAEGATRLCPNGQPIRTEASHNADPATIREHGVDAIAKELLLAVLGEAPTMVTRTGESGPFDAPMLMHGEEWRMNASLRHAIDTATATAPRHAAELLFGPPARSLPPEKGRR